MKKLIIFISTFVMLATLPAMNAFALSTGDVNGDGIVDASDASEVLEAYAYSSTHKGKSNLTQKQGLAADVNHDEIVDASDASRILQYYAYSSTGGYESFVEYLKHPIKYLDELEIIDSDRYTGNQGDSFVYPIGRHKYTRGNTTIDNISYYHGIEGWVARDHSPDPPEISWAYSTFKLNGNYKRLKGRCKLIKSYNTTDFDTTLEIWGDDVLLNTYHLTPESIPFDINVNISGCQKLKVYFYDNAAKRGGTSFGLINMELS